MADHNSDETSSTDTGVSPGTVTHAYRHVRALEADGIPVDSVAFNYDDDTYRVETADGFGGTAGDDFEGQGLGGGTIKSQ